MNIRDDHREIEISGEGLKRLRIIYDYTKRVVVAIPEIDIEVAPMNYDCSHLEFSVALIVSQKVRKLFKEQIDATLNAQRPLNELQRSIAAALDPIYDHITAPVHMIDLLQIAFPNRNSFIGKAKCHEDDVFDPRFGRQMAIHNVRVKINDIANTIYEALASCVFGMDEYDMREGLCPSTIVPVIRECALIEDHPINELSDEELGMVTRYAIDNLVENFCGVDNPPVSVLEEEIKNVREMLEIYERILKLGLYKEKH